MFSKTLLTLSLLASPALAQQVGTYPLHVKQLAGDLTTASGNVAAYVENAQTLPDFTIGYATGLAEMSQAFSDARSTLLIEVANNPTPETDELAQLLSLASTGFLYTAIEVNQGDVWTATEIWSATRDVVAEFLELMGSGYGDAAVDAAIAEFLGSMREFQDSLELLADPIALLGAYVPFGEYLQMDPLAVEQEALSLYMNVPTGLLDEFGLVGPEAAVELTALYYLLPGSTALDDTIALALTDPVGWTVDLALAAISTDFETMKSAAAALDNVLPDGTYPVLLALNSNECEDLCSSDADCPSTREYSLGTSNWGPGKFDKALNKAKKALQAAGAGSSLAGGPGKLVKQILKGGTQGIDALKGLNKLISAAQPVPYFRICRPRCKKKICPGQTWLFGQRYRVCTGKKCTKWVRLASPPSPTGPMAGNRFAEIGMWLSAQDIADNASDFDAAVDQAADDAIDAAGGEEAFINANS